MPAYRGHSFPVARKRGFAKVSLSKEIGFGVSETDAGRVVPFATFLLGGNGFAAAEAG
jgi:hypothetical protein